MNTNGADSAELECICLTRGAEERSFDPSRGRKPRSPHPAQARWKLHTPQHRRVEARTQANSAGIVSQSVSSRGNPLNRRFNSHKRRRQDASSGQPPRELDRRDADTKALGYSGHCSRHHIEPGCTPRTRIRGCGPTQHALHSVLDSLEPRRAIAASRVRAGVPMPPLMLLFGPAQLAARNAP
jgi:hypothetical protein